MRRRRLPRRLAGGTLAGLLLIAAVALADWAGLFGQWGDDLSRYDGRAFFCVRHVDGDTFHINARDGWSRTTAIRLWGVDTPETVKPSTPVQHFGREASEFTKSLTLGQPLKVMLVPQKTRDRYDRLLAYVYLPDGRMLNLLLIETGHAYADPRYEHPYRSQFTQAMRRARRQKLGLWAEAKPGDLPYYLREDPVTVPSAPSANSLDAGISHSYTYIDSSDKAVA